jgi:hypothetical protein
LVSYQLLSQLCRLALWLACHGNASLVVGCHSEGRNSNVKSSWGKGKKKRIPTSLSGWRKKIESFKREAQDENSAAVPLVYFCPLNLNDNHFTLLDINEQNKKIYHYDSMADEGVIDRTLQLTRVHKLVQVSYV